MKRKNGFLKRAKNRKVREEAVMPATLRPFRFLLQCLKNGLRVAGITATVNPYSVFS